ncbi:RNA binding protein, putative [Pseudomonas aeruginosa LESB58]|nr:RNA binding protein, putative [Pseudomonas aeruginosa LESB58]
MLCLGLVQGNQQGAGDEGCRAEGEEAQHRGISAQVLQQQPDQDRHGDAAEAAGHVHHPADQADPGRSGEQGRKAPVQAAPHQEEGGQRQQGHGGIGIFQARQQQEGDQRREARDRQQALGRQAAAHALADQQVAEEAADQGTDGSAEEDDEGRGADTLDIEAARLRQVARTPGQQAEEHHGPTGAAEDDTDQGAAGDAQSSAGLAVRFGERGGAVGVDPVQLGGVDPGMLGRVVAQVVPGQPGHGQGGDAGDEEGAAPGAEHGDQVGDDQSAESDAQRPSAVHQHGAAAAFAGAQPQRVELAAGGEQRRFRRAQGDPGEHQRQAAAGEGREGLEGSPEAGGPADHPARAVAVDQPAAGNLQQRVGPEEAAEDQPLHARRELEFTGDGGHGDGQRDPVDQVDHRQGEDDGEDAPADVAGFCGSGLVLGRISLEHGGLCLSHGSYLFYCCSCAAELGWQVRQAHYPASHR